MCKYPTLCKAPTICRQPTICQYPTLYCREPTIPEEYECRYGSKIIPDPCGCSIWEIDDIKEIELLRADLKATIQELDELEKEGLVNLPDDPGQLDLIEKRLVEALEQIRARKGK